MSKALTKYNLGSETGAGEGWPENCEGVRILVPGQVEYDASIQWGSPKWQSNLELLREVRRRHPDAVIAYKPHPDVVKRVRPGRALPDEVKELCDVIVTGLDILPWLRLRRSAHLDFVIWIRSPVAQKEGRLLWRALLCRLGID